MNKIRYSLRYFLTYLFHNVGGNIQAMSFKDVIDQIVTKVKHGKIAYFHVKWKIFYCLYVPSANEEKEKKKKNLSRTEIMMVK